MKKILPINILIALHMTKERLTRLIPKKYLTRLIPQHWKMGVSMIKQDFSHKRQLFAELIDIREKNYSGVFRNASIRHQDRIYTDLSLQQLTNGLIRSSALYYAITKDSRNGKINIYWARAQKHLKTEPDEEGKKRFVDDGYRYHCATLPVNAPKLDIRNAITKHHQNFRDFGINHMSLHGGNISDTHSSMLPPSAWSEEELENNRYRYETYAYSNDDFAVSVQENPIETGNGWTLTLYSPFERFNKSKSYVEIDTIPAHERNIKAIFSNGSPIKTYETREEALANMSVIINHRTQMTWRGEKPIKLSNNLLTNSLTYCYNFFAKEMKSPENRKEAEFDATFAAVLLGARALPALYFAQNALTSPNIFNTLANIGAASIAAVAGGFGARKLLNLYSSVKAELAWKKDRAHSIFPESGDYILPTKQNMNRRCNTTPIENDNKFIEVLDGNERDITFNDKEQIDPNSNHWKERWLCANDSKAFARQVSLIDQNTSSDFSFNGLIRLSHRNPKNGTLTTYTKYVEALDINAHISIPTEIKELLKNGEILKIEHKKGNRDFSMTDSSIEEMQDDIVPKLFQESSSIANHAIESATGHINWLFNDASSNDNSHKYTPMKHRETILAKRDRKRTYNRILGKEHPDIPEASKEMISFFKGCILPHPSVSIAPSAFA